MLPSKKSYLRAVKLLNPDSEGEEVALIIDGLEMVSFLIPISQADEFIFIDLIKEGLEYARLGFNKGTILEGKKREKYDALKFSSLDMIEASKSESIKELILAEKSLIKLSSSGNDCAIKLLDNKDKIWELFKSKFEEVSELRAVKPQEQGA